MHSNDGSYQKLLPELELNGFSMSKVQSYYNLKIPLIIISCMGKLVWILIRNEYIYTLGFTVGLWN